MSSSFIDPNICIMKLGIREFELQRRVFADNAKVNKPTTAAAAMDGGEQDGGGGDMPYTEHESHNNILYTDVTAAVYKQWNVIKKNKFGR